MLQCCHCYHAWARTGLEAFRLHGLAVDDEHTLHRRSILNLGFSLAGFGPLWQVAADDPMTTRRNAGNLHHRQHVYTLATNR